MEVARPIIIRKGSEINYDYATVKITQSRIDKGLLAVPVALVGWFPDSNETVQIYLGDSPNSQTKRYSSFNSSTRECRIGGLREWFGKNSIKSGDEIVIQVIDRERFIYRIIPERNFILQTRHLQVGLDNSASDEEASAKVTAISQWTHFDTSKVMLNEYFRLIGTPLGLKRRYVAKGLSLAKESAPPNLRVLLEGIYKGHCQVCDFWFLKRDNHPYFQIHHLVPSKGHHLRNLLVVCGNCHNQFEHANVEQEFNDERWLIRVSFNGSVHMVNQIALVIGKEDFFKETFV